MANEAAVADHLRTTDDEVECDCPWMVPPLGSGYYVFSADRFTEYLEAVGYGPDGKQGVPPTFAKHAKPLTDREWQRLQSLGMARWTYFARGKVTGRIKIGQSRQPKFRVSTLHHDKVQGEPSELLVVVRGDEWERRYHDVFDDWRCIGEWFAPHPDILAEIERLSTHPGTNAGRG